jgi:hypothetical protein
VESWRAAAGSAHWRMVKSVRCAEMRSSAATGSGSGAAFSGTWTARQARAAAVLSRQPPLSAAAAAVETGAILGAPASEWPLLSWSPTPPGRV